MTDNLNSKEIEEPKEPISWIDFLESNPPGNVTLIKEFAQSDYPNYKLKLPDIQLHCSHDPCEGIRFFEADESGGYISVNKWSQKFITYRCRNCQATIKTYAIAIYLNEDTETGSALKFGEWPPFGPPIPPRMLRLIGEDREIFLKGRRCENQGLGIGAFTYYRRVVENQWIRFIDKIIDVSRKISAPKEMVDHLEKAKGDFRFKRSIEEIKDAIPPVLLINGHNPLVLLHGALSQGVHELNDEECLSYASSIRIVLSELADNLGQALKDEKEVNDAVTKLMQVKSFKTSKKDSPSQDNKS